MPSSITATPAWLSPARFALSLVIAFTLTLMVAWAWGQTLIESLLPVTRTLLGWIDDRFGIQFLGVEHNWQDTVVRLRVNFTTLVVLGGEVITPHPKGWVEATTPVGDLLQPLVIAVGLAAAWPGPFATRLIRLGIALTLSLLFLIISVPLTLHAVIWDMLTYQLPSDDFSPLLAWLRFMQSGGRLGMGVLMGILAGRIGISIREKLNLSHHNPNRS